MSIYDEKYDIRQAVDSDIDDIMSYICANWKKDHILGNNRSFFDYEHVADDRVNYMIARERDGGEIKGIIGFLYASYSAPKRDVWTVMWMVSDGAVPLLGLRLFDKVRELPDVRNVIGVGDNKRTTVPMMKAYYHFFTGRLDHYYMLSDKRDHHIARISYYPVVSDKRTDSTRVEECGTDDLGRLFDFGRYNERVPYKDERFFVHRYMEHPIYRYKVYTLNSDDKSAIMVTRVQEMDGYSALRIIDYYGESVLLAGMKSFWKKALEEYEYIDFYCLGIDERDLFDAGFSKVKEDDENIIPDYFNPYVAENVDIYCTSSDNNTIFCKGDADQDRPVVG